MISISRINKAYILSFPDTNRFDIVLSKELEERINQFTENGSCRIVLNLKGIHFIDSKGFAMLVRVAKMAEEKKYSFGICNVSEEVKELINIMDFNDVFKVFSERLVAPC